TRPVFNLTVKYDRRIVSAVPSMPHTNSARELDRVFAALADPTRRAILARLARGDASVGDLAKPFDISLPAVSRHLDVLERARLIERRGPAPWRLFRLRARPPRQAATRLAQYRPFWETRRGCAAE